MPGWRSRSVFVAGLACIVASGSHGSDAGRRAAPSRPGGSAVPGSLAVPARRIDGTEYLGLRKAAAALGLRAVVSRDGHRTALFGPRTRADLEVGKRDATVNGLRVFLGSPVESWRGEPGVSRTDFTHCLAPLLRPGWGVAAPPVPHVIAIDPGHGGSDNGTENRRLGLKEKVLTLDVALRLRRLLESGGYRVVMTRTTDGALSPIKDVDLPMRATIANRAHADLFVSIHFNAAPVNTRGTEVYTYAPAGQHATSWWSEMSKSDADVEVRPDPVNRFDYWGAVFAQALHRELVHRLGTEDRGKKVAHWAVLRELECPGVLVEPAIISDDSEGRRVAQPWFRERIAESLAAGIGEYAAEVAAIRRSERNLDRTRSHPARRQ